MVKGQVFGRLATLSIVGLLILQACSSAASPAPPSAAASAAAPSTSAAAPSAAAGPVSFTLWSNETYTNVPGFEADTKNAGDWDKLLASKYMALHPNVKIDVQVVLNEVAQAKMIAAVQAGQPPDIYFDSGVRTAKWAKEPGLIEDMATLLPAATVADIVPAYKDAATVNGILYEMPVWEYPLGYVRYNKAIFDANGITIPADGQWSTADFEAAAGKIAKAGAERG